MADLSFQMESALKKHFDAKSQIQSRKQTGKYLYIAAWIVEIVAVLTGLLIALSNPYLAYNELKEPELIDKVLAFQGILPLFAIAIVEATKIPLAQGFYMSKMLRWKILFLTALLLLIFVTFETMINGLETNFSFTTNRIVEEETIISEKNLSINDLKNQIKNLDAEKKELEVLSEKTISEDSQKSISADNTARRNELAPLEAERDNITTDFNSRIQALRDKNKELTREAENDSRVKQKNLELTQKIEERKGLISGIEKQYSEQIENLKDERKTQAQILQTAIEEDSAFSSTDDDKDAAKQALKKIENELLSIQKQKNDEINRKNINLENEINQLRMEITTLTNRLSSSTKSQREAIQKDIDELEKQKTVKLNRNRKDIEQINAKYNENIAFTNKDKQTRITQITERQKRIPEIEKEKEVLLKKIEENNILIRDAKKAKREKIQENNVFRLTAMLMPRKCKDPVTKQNQEGKIIEDCPEGIYLEQDIANITKEDTKFVAIIWFGSISIIIAVIGVMLALASFVIRDEENFKAKKTKYLFNSFRRLITSFSLLVRNFGRIFVIIGKGITSFFDGLTHIFDRRIRDGIRRTIIGIRKTNRKPKEVIIEKEKIVFKEVPKEVIRREMVHVPLYSTEYGKVDLDSVKMSETATENFTNTKSEKPKKSKDSLIKNDKNKKKTSEKKTK